MIAMWRLFRSAFAGCATAGLMLAFPAWAAKPWIPSPPMTELQQRLEGLRKDAPALQAMVERGRRAAFFCANCHGETGLSSQDHVPHLAGQNAVYLLTQTDKFGDGRRKDEFMSGLVKVLKPEERFSIAVFYANQAVQPARAGEERLVREGEAHFRRACVGCHGPAAQGSQRIARLAGQREGYLVAALTAYRSGRGWRSDPQMSGVTKKLTDAQIKALAAYLSRLP